MTEAEKFVGFFVWFFGGGDVPDWSHFMSDLCKGNEKGHAIKEDAASLLVILKKMYSGSGDWPAAL